MAKAGAIIVDPADYPDYTTSFAKSPKLKSIYNNADWKAQLENYVERLIKNPQDICTNSSEFAPVFSPTSSYGRISEIR
jgi:hypothetical protein